MWLPKRTCNVVLHTINVSVNAIILYIFCKYLVYYVSEIHLLIYETLANFYC